MYANNFKFALLEGSRKAPGRLLYRSPVAQNATFSMEISYTWTFKWSLVLHQDRMISRCINTMIPTLPPMCNSNLVYFMFRVLRNWATWNPLSMRLGYESNTKADSVRSYAVLFGSDIRVSHTCPETGLRTSMSSVLTQQILKGWLYLWRFMSIIRLGVEEKDIIHMKTSDYLDHLPITGLFCVLSNAKQISR